MEALDTFDYEFEYSEYQFPRQSKRESTKYTNNIKHTTRHKTITNRNILQKEKQILDSRSKHYQEKERNQKQNGTQLDMPRTYHCATCNKETKEPCRCAYIQWCGKECKWEYCNESSRLGILDELAVSYDVLCDYHSSKYIEYLRNTCFLYFVVFVCSVSFFTLINIYIICKNSNESSI